MTTRHCYPEYSSWEHLVFFLKVDDVISYQDDNNVSYKYVVTQIIQGVTDQYPKLVLKKLD